GFSPMFLPRERNNAAAVPGSARRGRRQLDRPERTRHPELERLEGRITPAVRTWTGLGADNNWTTAANWDVAPVANDDLVFPDIADSARHTAVNDFAADTPFGSIRIGEAGYTLSGNALSEPGGLFADYGAGTSTINIATNLSSSFPNTVSVQAGGTLVLGGALSGANGINKIGEGLALFAQSNSYTGATTVNAGTLAIASSSALGSSAAGNGTTVLAGATLEIRGTINTSEPVSLAGTGVGDAGALFNGAGNNVVQTVTLAADSTLGGATTTDLLIPRSHAGGAAVDLVKVGGGVLDVLAAASYPGTTTIVAGTLAVEGSILNPIAITEGGTLAGAGGTVGAVTSAGGTYNPGFSTSPFTSDVGDLALDATSTFTTRLAGNAPGNGSTGYGQAVVTGGVALGGATLGLSIGGGYTPGPGDSLTIISNDGTDAIAGTFAGLPEGAYSSLGAGRTFRITYRGGDGNDVVLNYVRETTTTLASSANPSPRGQGVTFTATVASLDATPTGTVDFFDGATLIASDVAVVDGVATTPPLPDLTIGTHSITAAYSGDDENNAGTSAALSQVVSQPGSATSLAASPNPSVFGQSVTFTAIVTAVAPATGTPTGTVTFLDGATPLATVPLVDGAAELQISTLAAGGHSITASYSGDADFAASLSSATPQAVNRASLTATLVSSANPSEFGRDVTFTATFLVAAPGAGTPTGAVTFFDGSTPIGTAPLDGSGAASFVATGLGVGGHSITASYAGDDNIDAATTEAVLQAVDRAATTVIVAASPNPSVSGVDPNTSDFMSTWNFIYSAEDIEKVVSLARANFREGEEQVKRTVRAVYERKKMRRLEGERKESERRWTRHWKREGDPFR
ncbi:MAG: hypothetical protein Q9197_003381, partial [Variospora fuerteventurae]